MGGFFFFFFFFYTLYSRQRCPLTGNPLNYLSARGQRNIHVTKIPKQEDGCLVPAVDGIRFSLGPGTCPIHMPQSTAGQRSEQHRTTESSHFKINPSLTQVSTQLPISDGCLVPAIDGIRFRLGPGTCQLVINAITWTFIALRDSA